MRGRANCGSPLSRIGRRRHLVTNVELDGETAEEESETTKRAYVGPMICDL